MKKLTLYLAFLTLSALLLSLTACAVNKPAPVSRTEFIFGTIANITIYPKNKAEIETAETALNLAFERLHEIEKIFSYTDPESELSKLNASAFREEVEVSEELAYLIWEGERYSYMTGGAFDISLGELIELWGFQDLNENRVPEQAEIDALLPFLGYENINFNYENKTVKFKNEHIKIHLGALAKGFAANEAAIVLSKNEIRLPAIIDLGGDVYVWGQAPNENGLWRVGIVDPLNKSEVAEVIEAEADTFIATSGNYERFFEQDGVTYTHIFDRTTGYPVNNGLASVTIKGFSGASPVEVEAFSTIVFIMGKEEKWLKFLENHADVYIIEENGDFTAQIAVRKEYNDWDEEDYLD